MSFQKEEAADVQLGSASLKTSRRSLQSLPLFRLGNSFEFPTTFLGWKHQNRCSETTNGATTSNGRSCSTWCLPSPGVAPIGPAQRGHDALARSTARTAAAVLGSVCQLPVDDRRWNVRPAVTVHRNWNRVRIRSVQFVAIAAFGVLLPGGSSSSPVNSTQQ